MVSRKLKRKLKKTVRLALPLCFVCLVSIAAAVLHSRLYLSAFGQNLEVAQTDLWFALRGTQPPPSEVLLVTLDEATYAGLSFSHVDPFPRRTIADLVTRLAGAGARLAILDLFFRDIGDDSEGNRLLAEALGQMPTFIGSFRFVDRSDSGHMGKVVEVSPQAEFAERAEQVVLMNLNDSGKVRTFTLRKTRAGGHEPLVRAYAMQEPTKPIPAEQDLINYYGPEGTITRISALRVLQADRDTNDSMFRGKTVLIGSALPVGTELATKDTFYTPISERPFAGVEVHATVVGNVMRSDWIRRLPLSWEFPGINAVVVLFSLIITRLSPFRAVSCAVTSLGVWACVAYLFFRQGWFVPGVLAFLIVLPCVLVVSVVSKHTALKTRYAQFNAILGGEAKIS